MAFTGSPADDPGMTQRAKGGGKTAKAAGGALARAADLQRTGKPAEAERLCRQVLAKDPGHFDALHLLGLARAAQGDLEGAVTLLEQALAGVPDAAAVIYNLATLKQRQGHDDKALDGFQRATALAPDYAPAHLAAAAALHKKGRLADALVHYREGLARDPNNPPAELNLALAQRALGHLDEAEATLGAMLRRHPDDPKGLLQLGDLLAQRRRWAEARSIFERCRDLSPGSATPLLGLVGACKGLGDLEGAIAAARAALAAEPARPPTHRVLAILLGEAGEMNEALEVLNAATARFPDDPAISRALAGTAARAGRPKVLLAAYGRLLSRPDATAEDWAAFADAIRLLRIEAYDQRVADLVLSALRRDGIDWQNLAAPAISLIKAMPAGERLQQLADGEIEGRADAAAIDLASPAELFRDPLLLTLLSRAIAADRELELAMTSLRRAFLSRLIEDPEADVPEPLLFALAEQCFLNEYAFEETLTEAERVSELTAALARPDHPLAARLAAWALLACYRPLADCVDLAPRLDELEATAQGPLAALLRRHYRQPLEERAGRDGIPTLTSIGDAVSRAVRAQYEENPYPRWRALKRLQARPFAAVLKGFLPDLPEERIPAPPAPRILVAGCGTGRHALMTAQLFAGSDVLAIDLSRASLAYAESARAAAGIDNLRFAQADILELGDDIGFFDLIESSGVLHHLREPLAGWHALTRRLAPGGVMKIALYSQAARRHVVAVRERLAEQGFEANPTSIRQARRFVLSHRDDSDMAAVAGGVDFFSLSSCRDLLFHVQEVRFTIAELAAAAGELHLTLLGFEPQDPRLLEAFRAMHPDPVALRSWDAWAAFEARHPDSFAEMYHLWFQRAR
jgi:tetratricopeptide (TPR) repeat protein